MEVPPWLEALPLAPEYYPTEEEFSDPIGYILKIEQEALHFGICKIVPPYPKAPKRVVINNLNSSLAVSRDAPPPNASGSSASLSRSMGPARSMGGVPGTNSHVEAEAGGKARFTTRRQQLGWGVQKTRVPLCQAVTHKLVWQSGECYTLDQFEAKAKTFSRNRLGTAREVAPFTVETLFWRAASEKAISIEYANDISGSAFAEPSDPTILANLKYCKSKRSLKDFTVAMEAGLERQGEEDKGPLTGEETEMKDQPRVSKGTAPEVNADNGQGSACKLSNSAWNMRIVARLPGSLLRFMPDEVPGVTSPMVYIGMLFSWFAWHVEDHELHSLNYLHTGAPKTWYAVPGEAAPALEEAVRIHAYGGQLNSKDAFARLGEKTTVMSPEVLIAAGVPCCRLVQNAGEYVVTFPRAYHLGFSHGFNCGEAANLATPGWLHVAREAAARRAVMNYLPMLSHQQLLYMLALSLMSRSRSKKEQLSQLSGKQKAAEAIVKSFFLSDVIHHNKLLGKLLSHGVTSCLLLKDPDVQVHHTSSSAGPSMLSTSPNIEDNTVIATETNHPVPLPPVSRPDFCKGDSSMGSLSNTSQQPVFNEQTHGLDSGAPSGECKHDKKKETQQPFKLTDASLTRYVSGINCMTSLPLLDLGTMPCAACGMLCYSGMAVVQPSQTAAMVFRPLQTDVAGGNSLVGGSSLTGVLSAKADTTRPDFHILPSPEVAPLLESLNKSAETSCKDKQGEATSLTKDTEGLVSSTNFVKKSSPGAEISNMCSTPSSADKCGVLNGMVWEDACGSNLQGVHVSEENETMEVLKGQSLKNPLDEKVLVPAKVNGCTSRNLLHSDESGLCPIIDCSQPAVTTAVSPFSGLDVSSKRASQGPPVSSGQEISSSAREQHIDDALPRSKIGKPNGDKTISSLQLLATIYNGDSETDEADDKEENKEDLAEEVSVVGIPHIGSGGRRLDHVGLSADAPWDSISRDVPGIDRAPIFATHWQDCGVQICRFTNHDVPSTSQAMAKIFSPGGLLVAGPLHERSHVPGEETQSPSRTTSAKGNMKASSSSIPSRGEMQEDFYVGLEVVEKPSVDIESMWINESNSSNASLQKSGSLEASKAEKFKPEKDDNTSPPMASEIIAEHSTHTCCVEHVKVDKKPELTPQLVRTSPSMGPHSIKIKLAGSSPCEPHLKLTGLDTQIVLKGYQENRLQRPLGECVTCSLPHDNFFDSFEEIANGSICSAQKDAAVCDSRRRGLVCTGGVQMQTCRKTATIPVVVKVTRDDITTEGVLSFQAEANGHLPDTGSNIPVVISGGLEEVADRCSAQAFECNITRDPSDNTNDRVSQELEGMHVRREAQSNTGMMYGAVKPRVLCLEHAVTAQRLLEPLGGAHVVIVCHSRFPIMEQLAKETASEMGLHHDWKSIPMHIATDKEQGIITAALEVEEGNLSGQSDWVGQLELSTYDVDKMCNEHLNIDPVSGRYLEGKGSRGGGKRRRLKEKILVGEWCGRGWYSEELHPLLGGCRFMSSTVKVIGSSSNVSPPVNISNLSENGRPRRATRLTRLGDSGSENQLQFEVRKSGRMRRTVIDSAVDHSDEEDEDYKLITIVCSDLTQGRRTSQIGGLENRSHFLDHPPKSTPLWDQSNKHKEKDPQTHTISPQSSGNSAPEVTMIQDPRNPTLIPLQWQQDRFSVVGSCVRPLESKHLTCVEDARMQPWSANKRISQNPTSPVHELDNEEATNWLPNVPSPTTGDQGSHDEALDTPTECQFPTKATVREPRNQLQSCPDGLLHSEPSNCCSVVGGFLQRGAKLQALQKLCRQRATTQSESYSLLTTPARMASCENITCSNITTSRLINRPKRRSFTESSAQSVKKPKHVEEGLNKQDHVPRVSWEGENSSLGSILLFQEDQEEEEVKRGSRVIIADARCNNEENEAGVGRVSCSVVECNQIFESDNLLETHRQACHTLPLKTLRLKISAVSNLCTESSSHEPSGNPSQQFNRCSPPYEPAVVVPRRIVGARGRRTKGIGWKSFIQISPPGLQEEEDRPCQTWDENPTSSLVIAEEDLNREDCGSGVDADPDFSPYLSCLTSTSSRSRRRRARTPGMVEWGGVDDEGIGPPDLGDLDPNEETDDDIKSKKRKKSRKTAAQKRFEEPEGEYQCDMDGCTMGFDTEQDLQLHKRNRCTWKGCGKHFHMHKYLLQHRRVHLDDRPLKCPWKGCPQAFKWAWARTEHIRVHTGERPYKCTVSGCGQTFRFVSDFSRHKRNTGHRPS